MRIIIPLSAAAPLLLLAACGNQASDKLEEAAEQSDPAAANVLLNQAEALESGGTDPALADPNASVQQSLQEAGNAAAATPPAQGQQQPAPVGAKPHAPGDPVPPPKVGPPGQ